MKKESINVAIMKGGMQSSWKEVKSTSVSNSSIQITAPPPSPGIIVDRKVLFKVGFQIVFTGADQGAPIIAIGSTDGLRAYPLSEVISTLTVTLNNTQVSVNMNDTIDALLRYNTGFDERQFNLSLTPSMLDQFQNYPDYLTLGSNRHPLALWGENNSEQSRGAYPLSVESISNTSATVLATVVEPLFLSPFMWGRRMSSGFIGLQTFDMNCTFDGNKLSRVWSHSANPGAPVFSADPAVTVLTNGASLLFNYITPQQLTPIPRSVVYPYYIVDRYPIDLTSALAPGASTVQSSQNIQLHSIPRRMYIFARRNNSTRSYLTCDTYAEIKSLSVNWNNYSGLLSGATQFDLYKMSADNGVCIPFAAWHQADYNSGADGLLTRTGGYIGSVVCIEFGKDIALPDLEAPGLLGTYQLQFQADIKNPSYSDSINYTLYTVIVSEGSFTIMDNRSVAQIGVISKEDVLEAKSNPFIDWDDSRGLYGGDFFGSVGDFFKNLPGNVMKGVEAVAPVVKKGVEIAKDFAPLLPLVGLGKKHAKKRGRGVVGGRMMKRHELKQRMEDSDMSD